MRLLVRSEVGLVVTFLASVLVAYVGLAMSVSGQHRFVGVLVLVLGLWSLLAAPVLHARQHREQGEACRAPWGRSDRREPPWRRPG